MKLNDLNGQVQSLKTTHVECQFESLDGKVKRTVQAFTKSNVTNNLRPLSWNAMENKWRHLNEIKFIKFTNVGPTCISHIQIGVGYAGLHCAETEN